jgi:hypothetical protein
MSNGNEFRPTNILKEQAAAQGTVMPVAGETVAFMSGLETTEGVPLSGNVLRRTCMTVGEKACAKTCQLAALAGKAPQSEVELVTNEMIEAELDPRAVLEADPNACADKNLGDTLAALGIETEQALMVGVGADAADKVGFLDDEVTRAGIKQNPHGWGEVSGFNAFFAGHADVVPNPNAASAGEADPIRFLGARLADSGFVVVNMKDRRGGEATEVSGVIHSTRTNMPGPNHLKEYGGKKQSFMNYVLGKAMAYYNAHPEDVTMRVTAAVGPESWQKRFPNAQTMERVLPGWAEQGLIRNMSNPNWKPGMEIVDPETGEYDAIWPQYPHMVRKQVIEAAANHGIERVYVDEPLDPGKPRNGIIHSSANRPRVAQEGDGVPVNDTRDLYAVVINK